MKKNQDQMAFLQIWAWRLLSGFHKWNLLCFEVTTSLGVNNLENTQAMRLIFFSKFNVHFKSLMKTVKKSFCVLDNSILTGKDIFSVLLRKYLPFLSNMFTSCCEVSNVNKQAFFNSVLIKIKKKYDKRAFLQM